MTDRATKEFVDETISREELTEDDKKNLSPYLIENCEEYAEIRMFGKLYLIPLDKHLAKVWKQSPSKCKESLRQVIDGIYMQVRDSIGAEIHTKISDQVSKGFEKMYSGMLAKSIEESFKEKEIEQSLEQSFKEIKQIGVDDDKEIHE